MFYVNRRLCIVLKLAHFFTTTTISSFRLFPTPTINPHHPFDPNFVVGLCFDSLINDDGNNNNSDRIGYNIVLVTNRVVEIQTTTSTLIVVLSSSSSSTSSSSPSTSVVGFLQVAIAYCSFSCYRKVSLHCLHLLPILL